MALSLEQRILADNISLEYHLVDLKNLRSSRLVSAECMLQIDFRSSWPIERSRGRQTWRQKGARGG